MGGRRELEALEQLSVQLLIIKNNYFEVYKEQNLTFILLAFGLKIAYNISIPGSIVYEV